MPAISSWPLLVKKHSKNDEYSLCILIITTKKAPIYGRHLLRNDVILLSVTSKRHDCYAYLHSLLNLAVLPNYSHTQTLPLLFPTCNQNHRLYHPFISNYRLLTFHSYVYSQYDKEFMVFLLYTFSLPHRLESDIDSLFPSHHHHLLL